MEKSTVLRRIRRFLEKDLWEIPEVQKAARELEKLALKYDLYPSELLDFELGYDPEEKSIYVIFIRPLDDLTDDITREIHRYQGVISDAILTNVLRMLEGLPWEIVNEL